MGRLCIIQGEQIGRFFSHWAFVYFGRFCENDKSRSTLGLLFSTIKVVYVLILAKNNFGYILSDFCLNSSGHPVAHSSFSENCNTL
jgi:hypothetical protein